MIGVLKPDWPAPAQVAAVSTMREGGFSSGCYAAANLGVHVGDDPQIVAANRGLLRQQLGLAHELAWLNQVHGVGVIDSRQWRDNVDADGAFCVGVGRPCVVMTADCLPLLLCNRQGTWVAALHAGWRGLCQGVIDRGVATYLGDPRDLLVWLGPCIGPHQFEVGAEVRQAFLNADGAAATACFVARGERYLADLTGLARLRLAALGVTAIYGGQWCTVSAPDHFFSYRRDGVCGRMASLIWLTN